MLIGEVTHTIDSKGRYIVPAKFREDLGERFVVTKGLDSCLFLYPLEQWAKVLEALQQMPTNDPHARSFVRTFLARAYEVEVDKQSRALLTTQLREYAGIDREVVSVGVSTRVEIWDKEKWQRYSEAALDDFEDNAALFPGVLI